MDAPSHFVPKQAMSFDGKLFEIIGADETLTIAKYEMTLLPPFPSGAIIHDAACGLGPVTQSILATSPPDDIKFYATDIAPPMVGIYNQVSSAGNWPVKAEVMDAQSLTFPDATFSHTFLSFGLPIIDDPVTAAKEMYRTLAPGGIAVTAFWLQIPQGECAQETRKAVWGPDAHIAIEPKPQHKDRDFLRSLLVQGGFELTDVQLYEKSAFLPVKDLDEFARAIWTAIGQPPGGWTKEDEEKWDEAVSAYKTLLAKKPGYHVDEDGNVTLEAIAQICIAKKA
ncbi:S-adenosyl-L-methionine-dependent methyltransferase [Xylaria digitata]|nr:S-adenosyl-L-methionine-dependent methyltransferase [Xylaria digitata]